MAGLDAAVSGFVLENDLTGFLDHVLDVVLGEMSLLVGMMIRETNVSRGIQ